MNKKYKAFQKENIFLKALYSSVIVVWEVLHDEKESHRDQVATLKKECEDAIDEGIYGVFDDFKKSCDQMDMFFSGILIPR